jgi:hypothetical protein
MSDYYSVEKEFHDYAEDIKGVNIHLPMFDILHLGYRSAPSRKPREHTP